MAGKKRVRDVPLYVWVRPDELEAIRGRMEEAGIRNMSAYIRKMALNGYILHVDLSPVQELVSLQRRCANNLNQVATHANSYGVYQEEIKSLQKDYADLWGPLSDLLQKLSERAKKYSPVHFCYRHPLQRGKIAPDAIRCGSIGFLVVKNLWQLVH